MSLPVLKVKMKRDIWDNESKNGQFSPQRKATEAWFRFVHVRINGNYLYSHIATQPAQLEILLCKSLIWIKRRPLYSFLYIRCRTEVGAGGWGQLLAWCPPWGHLFQTVTRETTSATSGCQWYFRYCFGEKKLSCRKQQFEESTKFVAFLESKDPHTVKPAKFKLAFLISIRTNQQKGLCTLSSPCKIDLHISDKRCTIQRNQPEKTNSDLATTIFAFVLIWAFLRKQQRSSNRLLVEILSRSGIPIFDSVSLWMGRCSSSGSGPPLTSFHIWFDIFREFLCTCYFQVNASAFAFWEVCWLSVGPIDETFESEGSDENIADILLKVVRRIQLWGWGSGLIFCLLGPLSEVNSESVGQYLNTFLSSISALRTGGRHQMQMFCPDLTTLTLLPSWSEMEVWISRSICSTTWTNFLMKTEYCWQVEGYIGSNLFCNLKHNLKKLQKRFPLPQCKNCHKIEIIRAMYCCRLYTYHAACRLRGTGVAAVSEMTEQKSLQHGRLKENSFFFWNWQMSCLQFLEEISSCLKGPCLNKRSARLRHCSWSSGITVACLICPSRVSECADTMCSKHSHPRLIRIGSFQSQNSSNKTDKCPQCKKHPVHNERRRPKTDSIWVRMAVFGFGNDKVYLKRPFSFLGRTASDSGVEWSKLWFDSFCKAALFPDANALYRF